jgi:C4-dicarboxylate-specific signal transduction histidine kinase
LDELSHVNRVAAMGELAASLAHELNQPLTAILTNAQAAENFMLPGNMDLDEVRGSLSDITDNGRRAAEVIRRMRALLRKGEFQPVHLDFNALVREVAQLVAQGALLRRATVQLDLQPGLPVVRGDPIQLQQVVLNLLLNALDAVADQPQDTRSVRICTGPTAGGGVELVVEDSGPGIPEDDIPRLFQPFFTTKREGLGMGLSITRSIIDLHGGQIRAGNGAQGGAVFRCLLPVLRDFRRSGETR